MRIEPSQEIKNQFPEVKRTFGEIKIDGQKEMGFDGYGNVWNVLDNARDITYPTCCNKTMSDHGPKRGLYFGHVIDKSNLIGRALLSVDDYGLKVGGTLNEKENDIYRDMKDGFINMMSIGYRVVKADYTEDENGWIRHIREIKLFEISVLTNAMACNEASLITNVKSMDDVYSFINQNKHDMDFRNKILSLFGLKPESLPTLLEPGRKSTSNNGEPGGKLLELRKFLQEEISCQK